MGSSGTRFIPGPDDSAQMDSADGEITGRFDPHFYEKQVPRGAPWDTGYAFRLAAARAKDRARKKLVKAIRHEARELQYDSYSTLTADYLTRDRSLGAFAGKARANVMRSIDGVKDAPDDAIKL